MKFTKTLDLLARPRGFELLTLGLEMQKETVSNYCKHLSRIVKNKILLLEQREGNGAIVNPVTRTEYIDYMKSNGFKLVEERLASYGGHLRNDPSAPFSQTDLYFFEKAN